MRNQLLNPMTKYLEVIQDHYDDPYHRGGCECCTHAAEAVCDETGCQIRMELAIGNDGKIVEAWFEGDGCQVCEGLASLIVHEAEKFSEQDCAQWTMPNLAQRLGLAEFQSTPACSALPLQALLVALESPVDELADDLTDGTQLGGPSLREEC